MTHVEHTNAENQPVYLSARVLNDLGVKGYLAYEMVVYDIFDNAGEISYAAYRVWMCLYGRARRSHGDRAWCVRLSNLHIATALNQPEAYVERAIAELQSAILIRQEQHRDGPRLTYLTMPYEIGQEIMRMTPDSGAPRSNPANALGGDVEQLIDRLPAGDLGRG